MDVVTPLIRRYRGVVSRWSLGDTRSLRARDRGRRPLSVVILDPEPPLTPVKNNHPITVNIYLKRNELSGPGHYPVVHWFVLHGRYQSA